LVGVVGTDIASNMHANIARSHLYVYRVCFIAREVIPSPTGGLERGLVRYQ
jgi:hypothetical protein